LFSTFYAKNKKLSYCRQSRLNAFWGPWARRADGAPPSPFPFLPALHSPFLSLPYPLLPAPALACARPKATDKKANLFIQKCQKKFKITATFFSLSTDPSRAAFRGHSRSLELTQVDRLPMTSVGTNSQVRYLNRTVKYT